MADLLEITALPTLGDLGFTGGRDTFQDFCRRIFAPGQPRYARTEQGVLVVFRHADLMAFGTSAKVGSLPPGVMFPGRLDAPPGTDPAPGKRIAEVLATQVFTTNPPIHAATRRILMTWIGPGQLAGMEGLARDLADEVVRALPVGEEIDFVPRVAEAMTVGFWARLLQLTPEEAREMTQATREMTLLFTVNRQIEDLVALDATFERYARILEAAGARGLARGDPALVEIDRQIRALDFAEDIHTVGILPKTVGEVLAGNLIDGFHTAALASANACYQLARHPQALAAVRAAPELLPAAIAEALRMEPPVIFLRRWLIEDVEHDGQVVPAGQQVVMMWGAGNLDPAAFPDPQRFDITRRHRGLTVFGLGAHICPGRHVAVMLTRLVLERLGVRDLRMAPGAAPARWRDGHIMSQLQTLPMILSRAGQR